YDTQRSEVYTLSLHDALPICHQGTDGRYRGRRARQDLLEERGAPVQPERVLGAPQHAERDRRLGRARGAERPLPPPDIVPATERSEEHTSELQSRFDLVCRLL